MKLEHKLICITAACTLAVLFLCLGAFTIWQSERIISTSEQQARTAFSIFCSNLESLNRTTLHQDVSDVTHRSVIQYTFATYAHLLANNMYFSLAQNGEYLYNSCPIDPKALLPSPDGEDPLCKTVVVGDYYYVIAQKRRILTQDYVVYLVMNEGSVYAQVRDTYIFSAIMLVLSVLMVVGATVPSVRHAFRPLMTLRDTAERIAKGEYHLRAHVVSNDEAASLAASFNGMADAVVSRIDALTEESERRRLLLGALSHELKTPMTAIIGFADSMMKMPLSEEQRQHSLEQILSAALRTERMTEKLMTLLSLEGDERLEKQSIRLSALADELSRTCPANVRFHAEGEMWGDRDLLLSLLQNLINNALNASAAHVDVTLLPNQMQVSDDGRGIPAEHIARLTEPFYRVDKARSRKYGGAGLGLALCQAIAHAHGGTLSIESAVGKGTTVTVRFDGAMKSC